MLLASVPYWGQSIFRIAGVLAAVLAIAGAFVYVYLFKMVSFMQSRLGPMEAGPYGSMQLLAEVAKFLQKEDVQPAKADKRIFALAPIVVLASTFILFFVVPFGPDAIFTGGTAGASAGVFLALALSSISVIGILMAGWASANKYSLMGGLRAAGQLIAYELPMVLSVIGVVIQAETLDLNQIVWKQNSDGMFGQNWIGNPYILTQFVGFAIFMISAQAELTQTPFDMPVAESELVAGYMTEYSGFRFLTFFIAEFATAGAFAAIASTLFLGGWGLPARWFGWESLAGVGKWMNVVGPLILFGKIMLLGFIIFWTRFTQPRFREDQLQKFAWKALIPISLLNIAVTAILKVVL
jgi:NADH-quinone oxidoreductase subunit H